MRNLLLPLILLTAGCNLDAPRESSGFDDSDRRSRIDAAVDSVLDLIDTELLTDARLVLDSLEATDLAPDDTVALIYARGKLAVSEGDYESAVSIMRPLESARPNSRSSVDHLVGWWTTLGRAYTRLGSNQDAIRLQTRALRTVAEVKGEENPVAADLHHYAGLAYQEAGRLDSALFHYERALDLRTRVYGTFTRKVAATYNNLGNVYWRLGSLDAAEHTHRLSLEIKTAILEPDDQDVAISLANLGTLSSINGRYVIAEAYLQSALTIYRRQESHLRLRVPALVNLSSALVAQGRVEEGISAAQLALQYTYSYPVRNPARLSSIWGNLSRAEEHRGQLDSALVMAHRSLEFGLAANRPDIGEAYSLLGRLYRKSDDSIKARDMLRAGLGFQSSTFGRRTPIYIGLLNELALLELDQEHYDAALDSSMSALELNTRQPKRRLPSVHPSADLEAPNLLLPSLDTWLQAAGRVRMPIQDQFAILDKYAIAAGKLLPMYADRPEVLAEYDGIMAVAVQNALTAYRRSPSQATFDRLFRFVELSKGTIIRNEVNHASAVRFARIPDDMLERERRYKEQLAGASRRLGLLESNGEASTHEVEIVRKKMWAYDDSLASLLKVFEAQYPRYFALRHESAVVTASAIRNRIGTGKALIEYFYSGDSLHALVLSSELRDVVDLGQSTAIDANILDLRFAIAGDDIRKFGETAHQLYGQVYEPLQDRVPERELLIVPDLFLLNLPFETLAKHPPGEDEFLPPSAFLVFDKAISYAYSATLFEETVSRTLPPRSPDDKVFVIAPMYGDGLTFPGSYVHETDSIGAYFGPLRGTGREAVAIERLFRQNAGSRVFTENPVDVLIGQDATEAAFKNTALEDYRFIHVSAHAYTNRFQPERSGIVFDEPFGDENGVLHVGEVFGLEMDAELVYLSACDTGKGSILGGEGLIGMSRAFLYAGAQNLVVSLWEGHDQHSMATAAIFYDAMLSGTSRAEALRKSKLSLLMGPGDGRLPRNWAPYILIGE